MSELFDIEKIEVGETYKGVVEAFGNPTAVKTKFGDSYRIPLIIKLDDGRKVEVSLFVRQKTLELKKANPRSNIYKILETYQCKRLRELIGKTVVVRVDNRGFFRLVF